MSTQDLAQDRVDDAGHFGWLRQLTKAERRTFIGCKVGYALDAMDTLLVLRGLMGFGMGGKWTAGAKPVPKQTGSVSGRPTGFPVHVDAQRWRLFSTPRLFQH